MKLLNVQIDSLTMQQAIDLLDQPQIIFTPNPEILLEARKNKKFKRALKKGTLMLPDGNGLLFVSRLLLFPKWVRYFVYAPALILFLFWKKPFKKVFSQVIHGSDFMNATVEWAAKNKKTVFFLGGADMVAKKTAEIFTEKYPSLKLAGYSSLDPGEAAFKAVRKSGAQVLFVAYGAPKQELWIAEYAPKLPKLHLAMGVGGSFDFWSGSIKRAPLWMRRLGLEWLWRLLLNPKQRFKRIWNALVVFPLVVLFGNEN